MKIRNASGRPRTIAATGVTVPDGDTTEVDDDLGRKLCRQSDVWRESKPPAKGTKKESDQ